MKQFKPFHLLAITSVLLVIWAFFSRNETVDFHFHDTYIVMGLNFLITALIIIFIIYCVLYRLSEKILLSRWLTWIHVISCVLFAGGLFYILSFRNFFDAHQRRYHEFQNWESMRMFGGTETYVLIGLSVLVILQVIFPLNIIAGAIRLWVQKSRKNK
jgi:heme/copper-type cytochrome/quinol oxidase subunit 1